VELCDNAPGRQKGTRDLNEKLIIFREGGRETGSGGWNLWCLLGNDLRVGW